MIRVPFLMLLAAITPGCIANHVEGSGAGSNAPDGDAGPGVESSPCVTEPNGGTACASGPCDVGCTAHESGSGGQGGQVEAGAEGQAGACGSLDSLPPAARPEERAWCCPGPNQVVFPSCHGFDVVGIAGVDTASWYLYSPKTDQLVEVRHDSNGAGRCWGEPSDAVPRSFFGGYGIPDCPLGSPSSLPACAGVRCADANPDGSTCPCVSYEPDAGVVPSVETSLACFFAGGPSGLVPYDFDTYRRNPCIGMGYNTLNPGYPYEGTRVVYTYPDSNLIGIAWMAADAPRYEWFFDATTKTFVGAERSSSWTAWDPIFCPSHPTYPGWAPHITVRAGVTPACDGAGARSGVHGNERGRNLPAAWFAGRRPP